MIFFQTICLIGMIIGFALMLIGRIGENKAHKALVEEIKQNIDMIKAREEEQAANRRPPLIEIYNEWCKKKQYNGAVLIGSSIKEFFTYFEEKYPR